MIDTAQCSYCDTVVENRAEEISAHIEACDQHPGRQLKLATERLRILTEAVVEMRDEFKQNERRYHWALMRIRIALRDVDELKL